MSFTSVLRKASGSLLPVARRAVVSPRTLRGGISSVLSAERLCLAEEIGGRSFIQFSRFSWSSDKKPSADKGLIQVLQSEIECAEEPKEVEDIPDEFPFKIIDNPGERTIILKRNYQDEKIEVEVYMPDYDDEGEDGEDENNDDSGTAPTISTAVRISKGKGEVLEFGVVISPDEFVIDSLSIKNSESAEDLLAYEGPDFGDLDENLQKAFLKYLEIRGIKSSMANFLVDYMTNKDNKEYLQWLQNLKNFVEK